jgi:hypothetical protein
VRCAAALECGVSANALVAFRNERGVSANAFVALRDERGVSANALVALRSGAASHKTRCECMR